MAVQPGHGRANLRWESAQKAIALSLEGKWREAIEANQELLEHFPEDVETYNRLGRAHMELGELEEAGQAFLKAQELAPSNPIARRNLEKLSSLKGEEGASSAQAPPHLSPSLFVEETGKSTMVELQDPGPEEVLRHLSGGEPVFLVLQGSGRVQVQDRHGEYVGEVEPKLALRLINLMSGGNEYAAAIVNVQGPRVRIIIKETYQHPSQKGKASFPSYRTETFRSYVKSSLLQYGASATAEVPEEEAEDVPVRRPPSDDLEEAEEEGFSEEVSDEEAAVADVEDVEEDEEEEM